MRTPLEEGVMCESEFAYPYPGWVVSSLGVGGHTLTHPLCERVSQSICLSEVVVGTRCGPPADRGA